MKAITNASVHRIQYAFVASIRAILAVLLAGAALTVAMAESFAAQDGAVIIMYHRFGENRYPSTNIALDQFEAHLEEIANGSYTVLPLPDIIAAFRRREPLPTRTIGISIDDAFLSVYTEAWPRLRKAGLPFTLFIATDPVDNNRSDYMTWDQIRELASSGVTIGSQTAGHPHMPDLTAAQNASEIAKANRRFRDEIGSAPTLFAYPYGEHGTAQAKVVQDAGFVAAFGQHSGVAHAEEDLFGLPRFAMNEAFGSIKRFRLAANALPLPVRDITPLDTILSPAENPPSFGFTLSDALRGGRGLGCYASNQSGNAKIERLGDRRIEVRIEAPFKPGRGRINCTMPGKDGRWRWFGRQFYIPKP